VQDIPNYLESMDSDLRRNDAKRRLATFYGAVTFAFRKEKGRSQAHRHRSTQRSAGFEMPHLLLFSSRLRMLCKPTIYLILFALIDII